MSDIKEAVVDTKSLAKQFRSVLRVDAALDNIKNLEQVTREREEASATAREDAEVARDELLAVELELDAARDRLEVTEGTAVKIVGEAEQKAQELEDNAEIRVGGMVAAAQAQITHLTQKLAVAEKKHSDFIDRAAKEQQGTQDRTAAIRVELAALEAKFRSPE